MKDTAYQIMRAHVTIAAIFVFSITLLLPPFESRAQFLRNITVNKDLFFLVPYRHHPRKMTVLTQIWSP